MRVRAFLVALVLPLGLLACSSERADVVEAERSPEPAASLIDAATSDDERVLHPAAPCSGVRTPPASCGPDDDDLAEAPVPRRDIPGVFDDRPDGSLGSP